MQKIKTYSYGGDSLVETTVEVNVAPAGIGLHMVGLADAATKESLLRVATALQSRGYSIPGKKIVINITPANLRKNNTEALDLPIALGLLMASGQVEPSNNSDLPFAVVGEVDLNGDVRQVNRINQIVQRAMQDGYKKILVPQDDKRTDALRDVNEAIGIKTIADAVAFVRAL